MLFTAVALSAFAAVLASSAQAHIPEGNGTQPPSRTVVTEQKAPQGSGTFFFFTPDPEIYAVYGALTSPTVVEERLARQGRGTFFVDAKICAALDSAIRVAIQQCSHAHAVPLAATQLRTGTNQARLKRSPDGYSRLNP
jgi:hypothetical protein